MLESAEIVTLSAMNVWVVSRIDAPRAWPVFDSAWSDQEEAVTHMIRMELESGEERFPRYFIGLKVIGDEAHLDDLVPLGRPLRSTPVRSRSRHGT